MQTDADHETRQADERFRELSELDGRFVPMEPRFHHHLLTVVGPPFDERGRRKEDRFAHLGVDLPQMLELQKMPWIDLVNGDMPERREIEIPQVLFLPLRRPTPVHI